MSETEAQTEIIAALEPLSDEARERVLQWAMSRHAPELLAADTAHLPEAAVRAGAEVRLRQYESEYEAGHLTWRDFAAEVTEILEAALPYLPVPRDKDSR
jgi:hypothetical protein